MSEIELPKGWELKKVEDICIKITDGAHLTPTYVNDGVPFLRVKDIRSKNIDWSNTKKIPLQEHKELTKHTKAELGDILLSKNGTLGISKVVDWNEDFSFFVSLALLKPDRNIVSPHYLKKFFDSPISFAQIKKRTQKSTVGNLHLEEIREIKIPIPSLETQKRIVQKLDHILGKLDEKKKEIFEYKQKLLDLIDLPSKSFKNKLMQNQNLTSALRRSVLEEAFSGKLSAEFRSKKGKKFPLLDYIHELEKSRTKILITNGRKIPREQIKKITILSTSEKLPIIPQEWVWSNIESIETLVGSGATPKGGKSVYADFGIPFIRSQNVHPEGLKLDDVVFIDPTIHEEMYRSQLKPDDVLLNITGASIGRSTFIPKNFEKGNVNQHVCIIRTGPWMNPEYLSWYLNSTFVQKLIANKEMGQTREALNYSRIRSLPVPLTTIEEQYEIVTNLKKRFETNSKIQQELKKIIKLQESIGAYINSIQSSILDIAFVGNLLN